jgi:hypothetical protein
MADWLFWQPFAFVVSFVCVKDRQENMSQDSFKGDLECHGFQRKDVCLVVLLSAF